MLYFPVQVEVVYLLFMWLHQTRTATLLLKLIFDFEEVVVNYEPRCSNNELIFTIRALASRL